MKTPTEKASGFGIRPTRSSVGASVRRRCAGLRDCSAGDAEGAIDLAWNAIRRGLQNFLIELTEDPAGQTGWRFAANSRKSSATLDGLTSGKRYWFRVTAEGAAGPGPASNAATKVAP